MSDYLVDLNELETISKLYNPRVVKNTTIVTPETLKQDTLFHIALNKRFKLFPNISKRAGANEDNTVTRVHVAPTLIGCYLGYASATYLALNNVPSVKKTSSPTNSPKLPSIYKGGFYIHEIPFRCALKPNKSLVYDSDLTDEIWLVSYNEYTKDFPADIIGFLFINKLTYQPVMESLPICIVSVCVKIEKKKSIKFSLNNEHQGINKNCPEVLKEGYWIFDINETTFEVSNLKAISEKQFNEFKLKTAAMLEFE